MINKLQSNHALVILVADNLTTYVEQVRHNPPKVLAGEPDELYPDGRYNHIMQVCLSKNCVKNWEFDPNSKNLMMISGPG